MKPVDFDGFESVNSIDKHDEPWNSNSFSTKKIFEAKFYSIMTNKLNPRVHRSYSRQFRKTFGFLFALRSDSPIDLTECSHIRIIQLNHHTLTRFAKISAWASIEASARSFARANSTVVSRRTITTRLSRDYSRSWETTRWFRRRISTSASTAAFVPLKILRFSLSNCSKMTNLPSALVQTEHLKNAGMQFAVTPTHSQCDQQKQVSH